MMISRLFFIFTFSFFSLFGLPSTSVFAAEEHAHDHSDSSSSLPDIGGAMDGDSNDDVVFKYVCPMHPQIVRGHEGTCPLCGMDLVKQIFSSVESAPRINLSNSSNTTSKGLQQQFAIRTSQVKKVTLWKFIPTFGRVVPDETRVVHIHPRASGWISDLAVRNNGDEVEKGALLYRLYSPEIVSAQDDYLQVIQNRSRLGKQANSLMASAKIRLQLLGLSNQTIAAIAKKGNPINKVPIYAPQSGFVNELSVQTGMFIEPSTELMSVIDLSQVWVEAEVLPLQQAWLKTGLTVDVRSDAFPGENWESAIDYIYPQVDPINKALKVRVPLMNESLNFKPNMLVQTNIYGGAKRNVLAIPVEAVIADGQTQRVVAQTDQGDFVVKEVKTGMQTDGFVEVLLGLKLNEVVVISGQFMIDSESQIQTNLRRFISSTPESNSDMPMNH